MSNTLKFGNGKWATKEGSTLAYNDENGNFKPLPFNFTRSTSATRVNKQGLIEVVSNNEPRIDFKDNSNGVLLLEPSRSNLITYSEDFTDVSWSKVNAGAGSIPIVTANQGISPKGDLTADRVQFDLGGGTTSGDASRLRFSLGSGVIAGYTQSVYIKSNDGLDYVISLNLGNVLKNITITSEWQRFDNLFSNTVATGFCI